MVISFEKSEVSSILTARINGSIDTSTAQSFSTQVTAALGGVKQLVLDLTHVDYVSSSGLRVILSLNKQMRSQGSMCLEHLNAEVREVFELTGLDEHLDIKA